MDVEKLLALEDEEYAAAEPADDLDEDGCTAADLDEGDDELAERELMVAAAAGPVPLKYNARAPGKCKRLATPKTVTSNDGVPFQVHFEVPYYVGQRQTGHSVEEVADFCERVLLDSRGWLRAGIHPVRVMDINRATVVIRYVPVNQTACDRRSKSAVGCTSNGKGGRKLIEMEAPRFGMHKGLLHELAHAFGGAKHAKAIPGYSGVMGNSPKGIWLMESDVIGARRWLGLLT